MNRSLKPSLRRWRNALEPVSVNLGVTADTPEAIAQVSAFAEGLARELERPVILTCANLAIVGKPT